MYPGLSTLTTHWASDSDKGKYMYSTFDLWIIQVSYEVKSRPQKARFLQLGWAFVNKSRTLSRTYTRGVFRLSAYVWLSVCPSFGYPSVWSCIIQMWVCACVCISTRTSVHACLCYQTGHVVSRASQRKSTVYAVYNTARPQAILPVLSANDMAYIIPDCCVIRWR